MDRAAIETLLDQNLKTIKGFVELMITQQHNEITLLRRENEELKRSLEFTQAELRETREAVKRQERKQTDLEAHVSVLGNLPDQVRELEDYSRRNNIRITGLPELQQENTERLQIHVQNLLREKMNIAPTIDVIHRVGHSALGKSRPVIVRFARHSERQQCLRASAKLKGTNVYLSEDLSRATVEIQKAKRSELEEKRRQGYIAYFSGTRIISKKRPGHRDEHQRVADGPSGDPTVDASQSPAVVAIPPRSSPASSTAKSDSKKAKLGGANQRASDRLKGK